VGSRLRIAAAACLVASGLLAGGAGASIAFADPAHSGGGGDKHTDGSSGNGASEKKTSPTRGGEDEHPGAGAVDQKTEDDKKDGDNGDNKGNGDNNNGDNGVGNPGCGNSGNSGGNGNGRGCGGGGGSNDPDDPTPPTKPSTPPTEEEPPPPEEPPGNCEEKNDDHCSPGWPWWPWPWPWEPGVPPGSGGGGGGGTAPEVPSGRPGLPPQMQLPPELMPPATEPVTPSVIDAAPGVGVAAAELPIPPITLPVIVAPAAGLGTGGGSPGPPASPALPGMPRGVTAEPPAGREPLPASVGSNAAVPPSSYRLGYTDYLRSAGLSQVAALAVPGVAGMLVLTGAGGLVGYRQAKAGHAVHTSGTARFVN
jgi:hypothetical protein